MTRRNTRRAVTIGSVCLSVALAAIGTTAAFADVTPDVKYVALGDSYASGVGIGDQSGTCGQSPKAYPQLWKNANNPAAFKFDACTGADTATLQQNQLADLNGDTTLVTVNIGGNDIGFRDTMVACFLGESGCTTAVEKAKGIITNTLPGKLTATYAAIADKAPNAKIVVLGYPRLFAEEDGTNCGIKSLKSRKSINQADDLLNDAIESAVRAAGDDKLVYADVFEASKPHGACGPDPWVKDLSLLDIDNSAHANAKGHELLFLPALTAAASAAG